MHRLACFILLLTQARESLYWLYFKKMLGACISIQAFFTTEILGSTIYIDAKIEVSSSL